MKTLNSILHDSSFRVKDTRLKVLCREHYNINDPVLKGSIVGSMMWWLQYFKDHNGVVLIALLWKSDK